MKLDFYSRVTILIKLYDNEVNNLKILILGYSNIFKKRILNVLIKKGIKFSVASKSSSNKVNKAYSWFRSYDLALSHSNADLVYISLPNSYHFYWAKKALEKGYHVVVDKPISENILQAKKLIQIAKNKKKLIAEATFFNYHKQFNQSFQKLGGIKNLTHVNANFIIPSPQEKSILMSKKLSGGCFMDMAPYAAAVARLFCAGKLIKIYKNIKKNNKGLITSFNFFCIYEKTSYAGSFSFGGEYDNSLSLHTSKNYIHLNNVFSPPSKKRLKIIIREKNLVKDKIVKKDDIFENFMKKIKISIKKKKFDFFYKIILEDSKFKEKILNKS